MNAQQFHEVSEDIQRLQQKISEYFETDVQIEVKKRTPNQGMTDVVDTVCYALSLDKDILLSKNRKRVYVDARKIITHILFNHYNKSLTEAGKAVHKDHSTAFTYRDSANDLLQKDEHFKMKYDRAWKYLRIYQFENVFTI